MKLLTTSNPKTQKGVKYGWLTTILHLAPSKLSGINVCLDATPECIRFCLNKAGRGGIFKKGETTNHIQDARIRRTNLLHSNPFKFWSQLEKELGNHQQLAKKMGLRACARLNGTSDIEIPSELLYSLPSLQFYDYTKDEDRYWDWFNGSFPENYHLTLSRSEYNEKECMEVLNRGGTVAAVFDRMGASYRGYPIHSGDDSDLRFLDPSRHWIGLTPKGKLKHSNSPFKVPSAYVTP